MRAGAEDAKSRWSAGTFVRELERKPRGAGALLPPVDLAGPHDLD
jgi:hypothetical protein